MLICLTQLYEVSRERERERERKKREREREEMLQNLKCLARS